MGTGCFIIGTKREWRPGEFGKVGRLSLGFVVLLGLGGMERIVRIFVRGIERERVLVEAGLARGGWWGSWIREWMIMTSVQNLRF